MDLKFKVPNYVTNTLYASYFFELADAAKKYKIDTSKISSAIRELGQHGKIEELVAVVQEFLFLCSPRDKENFNENSLKHVFAMTLAYTSQFWAYGEYPAGQGFLDMYIQKSSNSLARYEAVIELKYLKESEIKKANIKKLKQQAQEQIQRYLQDKRMSNKENLKKYIVIFKGFEDYYIEEIV